MIPFEKRKDLLFTLLQMATFTVFLGRAWQHWFWDAPFRTLLWEERWMKELVENLSTYSWEEYITSPQVDAAIQGLIRGHGLFYFFCALLALFIHRIPKWLGAFLGFGALSLAFLAALYCKEKFFSLGQFLEYALQFSSPLMLYLLVFQNLSRKNLLLWMKIAIALTFTCHGLYALNFYPRPGNFVQMTIDILGVSESRAIQFLILAGILDFVIAIGIFLPSKIARAVLLYAFFWGLATSLARIWANFYLDFPLESLHQWIPETLMRLPHALIPLAVWWELKNTD